MIKISILVLSMIFSIMVHADTQECSGMGCAPTANPQEVAQSSSLVEVPDCLASDPNRNSAESKKTAAAVQDSRGGVQ